MLLMHGCNGLFAQSDSTEQFVFLEYGFAYSDECSSIKYSIGDKWNIDYKRVANCMVTSELVDSVRIFNLNTSQRLSKKYGADWEERYQGEIAKAVEKCRTEVNLSKIDTVIRENDDVLERVINNPDFNLLRIEITQKKKKEKDSQPLTILNLQDDSNKILYLGFPNTFEINLPNSLSSSFTMECINCEIKTIRLSDSLTTGQYTIRAKRRKETFLTIYAQDELITSHEFDLHLLPDPEIYFNEVRSGNSISKSSLDSTTKICVRYTDDITLRSDFTVDSWEMYWGKTRQLWGYGSDLNNTDIQSLRTLEPDTQISFICKVKGPDGILRKKAGAFILK